MKIKKFAAAAAAIAVLSTAAPMTGLLPDAVSLTASAEEQKLLLGTIEGSTGYIRTLGDGFFFDPDIGLFKLGESELDEWRKTGKLTPSLPKNNTGDESMNKSIQDLNKNSRYTYFDGSTYKMDLKKTLFCVFDKENNTIDLLAEFDNSDSIRTIICDNGLINKYYFKDYEIVRMEWIDYLKDKDKVIFAKENDNDPELKICVSDKYYGYYCYNKDGQSYLCGLLKSGESEILEQCALKNDGYYIEKVGDGYFTYFANTNRKENGEIEKDYYVYLESTGKSYYVDPAIIDSDDVSVDTVCGNVAIARDYIEGKLIELNDNGCKALTEKYQFSEDFYTTTDGEIFMARIEEAEDVYKSAYIDKTGKVLATGFDQATPFCGDYAAVIKDKKGYLIDHNMNKASEEIDAVNVMLMSKDLFSFDIPAGETIDRKLVTPMVKSASKPTTPDKPTTPASVDFSDDTTGIKASADTGVIEDGAKLSVAAVADKTNENNFTYEISFKKDDKEVQPNGKVTVKIPVPEAIKDKTIFVYYVEDGKYTDMNAKVENGFVVFETDHFSEYLVTTENKENKPGSDDTTSTDTTSSADSSDGSDKTNPATGIAGGVFGIMAIAGAFVIVSKKRR